MDISNSYELQPVGGVFFVYRVLQGVWSKNWKGALMLAHAKLAHRSTVYSVYSIFKPAVK